MTVWIKKKYQFKSLDETNQILLEERRTNNSNFELETHLLQEEKELNFEEIIKIFFKSSNSMRPVSFLSTRLLKFSKNIFLV